jgi:hypothetical protein
MAVTYPDILNNVTDARERYEVDGVQFSVKLESERVPAGQALLVQLYVQNALDQPVQFTLTPGQARTGMLGTGLLRGGGGLKFETMFPQTYIDLASGEAGAWRVPLGVPAGTPPRMWDFGLSFQAKGERAQRVRSSKVTRAPGHLATLLDDYVGLGIVPIVGAEYDSRDGHRVPLRVEVTPATPATARADLTPEWSSLWTQDEISLQSAAMREINGHRIPIVEELGGHQVFEALYNSAQMHLDGAQVAPEVGEVVGLAKILTYTVGAFMYDEETQNALLVPAYMETMRGGTLEGGPVNVMSWGGFPHLVRLATALSFRAISQSIGRQPWSLDERRGVTQWISQCLVQRLALQPEFLYLPLMLGALTVMPIKMSPDETPLESFKQLGFAWQSRQAYFKQEPDLAELVEIFNTIARKVVGQVAPVRGG